MAIRKALVLAIGLLILVCVADTLYRFNFISSTQPRKPKIEIPVTYNIGFGWGYNQDTMQIDNSKVDVVERRLNWFNKKLLLSNTATGQLRHEGSWKPVIKGVHISERVRPKDAAQIIDAEIQITPIVGVKEDKSTNGETINSEFTKEHTVESMHWGKNTIRWTCGHFEQIAEWRQDQ